MSRTHSLNRVFLGGINVYLQQHFKLFRRTPWVLDRLLDFAPLLRFTTRWGVSVDPARLGRLTVSMLQGTAGFQRKEILKLVRFLADEVAPEIVNIPNSLLISLAPAIKAEMDVPVCCTLQGEELFLDGLGEPYRSEVAAPDPRACRARGRIRGGQPFRRPTDDRISRDRARPDPCCAAGNQS